MCSAVNSALYKHSIYNLRVLNMSVRDFRRAFILQARFNASTIDYLRFNLLSDALCD